jgi:hypothetical protein
MAHLGRCMRGAFVPLALTALLTFAGCSHMPRLRSPFAHKPPPPPEVANELVVAPQEGTVGVAFPQYWVRNAVVLDLETAAGAGGVVVRPKEGTTWPVRLALRVKPGSVGQLEIRADQRVILPIAAEGTKPVDLELAPSVYSATTEQMTVSWGPAAVAASN